MNRLQIVFLAMLALLLVQGGGVAQADAGRFIVTDTAQGAVRLDVNTGRSWLLVTGDGRPRWVEIAEPAAPAAEALLPVDRDELRLPDARYKVARDGEGRSYGIELAEAGSALAPLEAGDVITQIEHFHVRSILAFRIMLRRLREADLTEVPVKVLRKGEEKTLTVKLSVLPPDVKQPEAQEEQTRVVPYHRYPDYGYPETPPLEQVSRTMARRWDVATDQSGNATGLLIGRDGAIGPLEAGDIMTTVESQPVRSMADFRRIVRKQLNADERVLSLTVTRNGEEKTLEWDISELTGK